MSKRAIVALFLFGVALAGLSACSPTCDPGSLVAPDLVSPIWWEVVDGGSAALEWSYPDTCEPDNFEIILSQDRDFSTIEITQLVPGGDTTWTPPALDVAEEYFWRVRAKVGSTYGPYSHELRSFFTLPYCDAADLVMPSLVLPAFGGIFDRGYDSLEWEWPLSTCIPESYRVEVDTNPSFSNTTYNGGTGNPSTRWGFGSTPPAATQFWWRITPYSDGVYGPPSMAKMFWTDPVCSASSLLTPVQESPLDNEVVSLLNPIFVWSYPDSSCTPEGFHVWVSDTPDMSHIVLEANNPTIAALSFQAGVTFDDCGEYYWRIAAISDGAESLPSPIHRLVIDSGSCDCAAGSIVIPVPESPEIFEVLPDTNAHLTWSNPGGCFPDGAAVDISNYSESVQTSSPGEFVVGYDPPGLDPATQYNWRVAYYINDGEDQVLGDFSPRRIFFTGPECGSLAEVAAPDLLGPADGEVVDTLTPTLSYAPGAPACIPDGYLLHLHTMADFSDPNLLDEYSIPVTRIAPTDPLTDCQTYYWSVTAVKDGGYGPESEVRSFSVDVDGTCLPGVPARAIKNNFCRTGTYPEYFEAVWTYETGDPALAIARNPFNTYLQLMVLDPKTGQPLKPAIVCWSLFNAFKPGFEPPEDEQDIRTLNFENLPVVNPPPTPIPTLTPTPVPICNDKMDPKACVNAGGTYNYDKKFCSCYK